MKISNNYKKKFPYFFIVFLLVLIFTTNFSFIYGAEVDDTPFPVSFDINVSETEDAGDVVSSLQILFFLTLISLAPSLLIMLTSFTRIIVVLHFVRAGVGTQQSPPNQVLVGLALFLTLFIMSPTISEINETAIEPYTNGEISQREAIDVGLVPIRKFMFKQVVDKDLELFMDISGVEPISLPTNYQALDQDFEEIPTATLIPAFIISELRSAFIIGFIIYIPFIVIDMVVASTLMSMGMMMLPPITISLPFKILIFVIVDGWNLIIGELVKTFY